MLYSMGMSIAGMGMPDKITSLPLKDAIREIQYDRLGKEKGRVTVKTIDENSVHVKISFSLSHAIQQDDWQLTVKP